MVVATRFGRSMWIACPLPSASISFSIEDSWESWICWVCQVSLVLRVRSMTTRGRLPRDEVRRGAVGDVLRTLRAILRRG